MSIFVKDSDLIEVVVHYTDVNGNIVIVDETIEPTENTTALKVKFRRPDFSISQRLVASSTSVDQSGSPSVNLLMLQNNMLYFLAKEWDAKEPDTKNDSGEVVKGKDVELNADSLGSLRIEIARSLITKLLPLIGQIM